MRQTTLNIGNGATARNIAIRTRPGSSPGLCWLGGFMSDMQGTKAVAVDELAKQTGKSMLRFDYSGHGESSGEFTDGTIGRWLEESVAVFKTHCQGPQIIIGSSMGGWLALLLIRELKRQQITHTFPSGLILIAPAVDFTDVLIWQKMPPTLQQQLQQQGLLVEPSPYEQPYRITYQLIEEGRQHLLLNQPIITDCPVHILQGMQDTDVPWQHAIALSNQLATPETTLTLIKDADHRLARPQDIARLTEIIKSFY